jgi:hypothetical protein
MRAGAIPLLAWAALLAVLMIVNWIWTGDALQVGTFAFAVLAVLSGAALVAVLSRGEALRPGPPEPSGEPELVVAASAGAVLAALGIASIVFGFVFGTFPIYFGAGVLVIAAGRLVAELRSERQTRERLGERRRP